jgi:quercetin dioxygenase-like cupin family protein
MSPRCSNRLSLVRSGALILTSLLALAGCDGPLPADSQAATLSTSFQIAGSSSFTSVGLGAGMLDSRVHLQTQPERAVKIVSAKVTIPPDGGFVPWHTHPMPGVLVVVTGGGTLTLTSEDCTSYRYPTGAAFQPPHGRHIAQNLTSQPIELLATFIIEANKDGVFQNPTTLEPAEVQAELNAKCGI